MSEKKPSLGCASMRYLHYLPLPPNLDSCYFLVQYPKRSMSVWEGFTLIGIGFI